MISVVIPAFNEEKLISKCLESLKKQDYTGNYEIVVVDNGSLDSTGKIAKSMGARVVFCSQKGVAYARQTGAEAARGEIILQADADTIYPVWWIKRIKKQFARHPKIIAVAGSFIYTDPPWWACFEYFLRVVFGFLSNAVFGKPLIVSGANFAFYKKALIQIGGYRQGYYSSDQLDISGRLRKVGKILYDGRSYGATSNRAVSKPTIVVMKEFGQNLYNFAKHSFFDNNGRKRSKKLRSVSTGT